jgi:membrane-bound metal-dependent hydrolase YbcI (DUF457 family)
MTLACGAVFVGVRLLDRVRSGGAAVSETGQESADAIGQVGEAGRGRQRLADVIDYRLVAFGAVIPDLIDKLLLWVVLRDFESGGHHFGHSLSFALAILVAGLLLGARGDIRLLLIGVGDLLHVLSDAVSHIPHSLLWPLLELDVPRNEIFLRASNVGGEFAAVIIIYLVWKALQREERHQWFLREGRL